MSAEHDRAVRRDHNKLIKEKARAARELKGKVIRAFKNGIVDGRDEDELRTEVIERFDLTPRRLENILERRSDFGNAKANALTEARALVKLDILEKDVGDIRENCDRELDRIDELEEEDQDGRYPLKKTETTGAKANLKTEYVPFWEARHILLKRKADALDRYFAAMKALRGNTTLINIDNRTYESSLSDEDLDRRIAEGKQRVGV